jgi:hypothetical protein
MDIRYNTEYGRWEVYGENCVIRGGEEQPCFVSESEENCAMYIKRVEGNK